MSFEKCLLSNPKFIPRIIGLSENGDDIDFDNFEVLIGAADYLVAVDKLLKGLNHLLINYINEVTRRNEHTSHSQLHAMANGLLQSAILEQ